MLKHKPENSVPFLSAVDILIVHVSVATVFEWGRLHPSFAHLKKCCGFTISKKENSVLKQVFLSLKWPIQDEMDLKKKNHVLTQSLIYSWDSTLHNDSAAVVSCSVGN